MDNARVDEKRIQLAEGLLQEAVYQSRARQAAGIALVQPTVQGEVAPGGCGLGSEAAPFELSERGEELRQELWPRETPPTEAERIRGVLDCWVELQDAFDRKRNHFLRDFRKEHGFDRRDYSKATAEEFDAGLARINAEVEQRRRELALGLLGE